MVLKCNSNRNQIVLNSLLSREIFNRFYLVFSDCRFEETGKQMNKPLYPHIAYLLHLILCCSFGFRLRASIKRQSCTRLRKDVRATIAITVTGSTPGKRRMLAAAKWGGNKLSKLKPRKIRRTASPWPMCGFCTPRRRLGEWNVFCDIRYLEIDGDMKSNRGDRQTSCPLSFPEQPAEHMRCAPVHIVCVVMFI